MPTKRFLEIQKVYSELGEKWVRKAEISYLLKRLQKADMILEAIKRDEFIINSHTFADIEAHLKEE